MDFIRFICLGFAQSVLLLASCKADDDVVPDSAASVKFDFAQRCKVGNHVILLEKTTLADVVRTVGSGVIRDNGKDAGEYEFFVDYTDEKSLIRFSSNAEMGGEKHELGEVEIKPLTASDIASGLPSLHLPITFQFGSLGISFSDLVTVLGPSLRTHEVAWYEYNGKRAIKDSSGKALEGDVLATLRVKIIAGKVVAIQLGHVTTY